MNNAFKIPSLTIVVPCYNEEEIFQISLNKLTVLLADLIHKKRVKDSSYILFVDDGSKDSTWELIKSASENSCFVRGLKLSSNKGHQIALMAGLLNTSTDVTISIDADLQDDIFSIEEMLEKYSQGYEIVYGVRSNRDSDSKFKKITANIFYSLMDCLGVKQIPNHADFRLMGRTSLLSLSSFKERNVYLRGLIPLLGYKSINVYYRREERIAGESKYPLRKMISLALEGITSLSVTPLRFIAIAGIAICFSSLLAAGYAFFEKIQGNTVAGWTSMSIAIFFLGGVQMLSLGIIGEYVGKIYIESKNRPKYFIEEDTEKNNF